jgi:hypothetical protein
MPLLQQQAAGADVGLMFTAYNLRLLMNVIDKNVFKMGLSKFVIFKLRPSFLRNSFAELFYPAA